MKTFVFAALLMSTSALSLHAQKAQPKILIVYYSWGGNTRVVAQQLEQLTKGKVVEILPVEAYPSNYQSCVDQAKKEIKADFKPAISTKIANIQDYDYIFVGSPNWWSTIAPPVASFLSQHDLSNKTVVPFVTHGGGSIGKCETDIIKLCPKAKVLTTLYLPGDEVKKTKGDVESFLKKNGLLK